MMNKQDYIRDRVSDLMYEDSSLTRAEAYDRALRGYDKFLNEETFLVNSFVEEDEYD
jgi:hypothetical protein